AHRPSLAAATPLNSSGSTRCRCAQRISVSGSYVPHTPAHNLKKDRKKHFLQIKQLELSRYAVLESRCLHRLTNGRKGNHEQTIVRERWGRAADWAVSVGTSGRKPGKDNGSRILGTEILDAELTHFERCVAES